MAHRSALRAHHPPPPNASRRAARPSSAQAGQSNTHVYGYVASLRARLAWYDSVGAGYCRARHSAWMGSESAGGVKGRMTGGEDCSYDRRGKAVKHASRAIFPTTCATHDRLLPICALLHSLVWFWRCHTYRRSGRRRRSHSCMHTSSAFSGGQRAQHTCKLNCSARLLQVNM